MARIFKENIGPDGLKFKQNCVTFCNEVFDKMITKGEVLVKGTERVSVYTGIAELDNFLSFFLSRWRPIVSEIYQSERTDPKYTTAEDGNKCIGMIVISPTNGV